MAKKQSQTQNTPTEQSMPHNLEAERAFLGSILLDNGALRVINGLIHANDFFADSHGLIFREVLRLCEDNRTIDLVSLADELGRAKILEKVGGIAYISGLSDGVPMGDYSFVGNYARIIKQKSTLRRIIRACSSTMSEAFDDARDPQEIISRIMREAHEISTDDTEDSLVSYQQATEKYLDWVRAGGPRVRIKTGFDPLDDLTGGFWPGELVIYTAETGVGKTVLASQTRKASCDEGYVSLFCSCEMSDVQMASREIPNLTTVPRWKMRKPEFINDVERQMISNAAKHQCNKCKIMDGLISIERIQRAARAMASRDPGLHLLICDYDELISAPGDRELDQMKYLVEALKKLAVELSIPVVLISQLSKPMKDSDRKKPTLTRLYGTGSKMKNASFVIYCDREYLREFDERVPQTRARIFLLKARDARAAALDAVFNIDKLRFETEQSEPTEMEA
jgi:replicative DNA helicase